MQAFRLLRRTGATGLEPATFGFGDRPFSGRGAGSRARPAPRSRSRSPLCATRDAFAGRSHAEIASFNRYLGVAVGEYLGYLLTGTWTALAAIAMLQSSSFEAWLAWPGIAIGVLLVIGSFEFVGRFEEKGWKLAGTIVPIAYTVWSLWLVAAGIVLVT